MTTTRNPRLDAIEINLLLNEERSFLAASMLLCNELRARTASSTVALGTYGGHQVKLVALSNTKKFNRREPRLAALAFAMEECAEQDEEIQAPRPEGESFIAYEHAKYLRDAGEEFVLSLPVRAEGRVIAVVTLERSGLAYSEAEQLALRMICDLASRRLFELWIARGLGIPRRMRQLRSGLAWVFGVRHTWAKLAVLLVLGLLAFVCLYPWFYRVEATFELRADRAVHISSTIDGYLAAVHVQPGDVVAAGTTLLELDTLDLELLENEALAKIARLQTDADHARAVGNPAQSRLALAEVEEEQARLSRIRRQIELASIRAPWDGVIIEGDLRERIGSPVAQGDGLLRISALEGLYVRLEIPERSIHEVYDKETGELAFASRPETKYTFVIDRIEPVAATRPEGSVFLARARIEGEPETWWRPGMTGVAKIDVGERRLIWVLTHKFVDFVRLKLWI